MFHPAQPSNLSATTWTSGPAAAKPSPRSEVGGRLYQVISHRDKSGCLDFAKAAALLEPERDTTIQPLPMSL